MKTTESDAYILAAVVVGILLRAAMLTGAIGLLYWLFFMAGRSAQ